MASRPGGTGGLGRGGRGAALLQLLNQSVRAPGDAASQHPAAGAAAASGAVPPSAGLGAGEPAPPGHIQSTAPPSVPQAQLPQESAGQPMGRGAMLQKLYDSHTPQQQQQPPTTPAPSEASSENGG